MKISELPVRENIDVSQTFIPTIQLEPDGYKLFRTPGDEFLGMQGPQGPAGSQGVAGPAGANGAAGAQGPQGNPGSGTLAAGSDTEVQFNNLGATTGATNLTYGVATGSTTVKNIQHQFSTVTYAASVILDFVGTGMQKITLAGNITFTTANRAAGRSIAVIIVSDGSTRTFTFPAGWVPIGSGLPADIAANKTAVFSLTCTDGNDTGIIAAYAVQP